MTPGSAGTSYWFAIGAVMFLALSYALWRRGLRLYAVIGTVVAIMMGLFGYWSDMEITGSDEPLDIPMAPTFPSITSDDIPPD